MKEHSLNVFFFLDHEKKLHDFESQRAIFASRTIYRKKRTLNIRIDQMIICMLLRICTYNMRARIRVCVCGYANVSSAYTFSATDKSLEINFYNICRIFFYSFLFSYKYLNRIRILVFCVKVQMYEQ